MHRVQLHYTLSRDAGTALIRNPLPELLQAVAERGSISGAARALDLSYRHVWGALKRWEDQLGGELIIWGKGQSAQLSEFGSKLLRLGDSSGDGRSQLVRASRGEGTLGVQS